MFLRGPLITGFIGIDAIAGLWFAGDWGNVNCPWGVNFLPEFPLRYWYGIGLTGSLLASN